MSQYPKTMDLKSPRKITWHDRMRVLLELGNNVLNQLSHDAIWTFEWASKRPEELPKIEANRIHIRDGCRLDSIGPLSSIDVQIHSDFLDDVAAAMTIISEMANWMPSDGAGKAALISSRWRRFVDSKSASEIRETEIIIQGWPSFFITAGVEPKCASSFSHATPSNLAPATAITT